MVKQTKKTLVIDSDAKKDLLFFNCWNNCRHPNVAHGMYLLNFIKTRTHNLDIVNFIKEMLILNFCNEFACKE